MTDKKYCFWPQKVHSSRYMRDGFIWLDWAYEGVDGKWFRHSQIAKTNSPHKDR